MNVELFDGVALIGDLPEYNLRRGQVGTVVEVLANGTAFEVEFSDRDGRTYESVGLLPDQIMVLHYEPINAYSMYGIEHLGLVGGDENFTRVAESTDSTSQRVDRYDAWSLDCKLTSFIEHSTYT